MKRTSGAMMSNGFGNAYWGLTTLGPNSEAWVTIPTKTAVNDTMSLYVRLQNPGVAASVDGYQIRYQNVVGGFASILIRRVDNDSSTNLGAGIDLDLVAGDSLGLSAN